MNIRFVLVEPSTPGNVGAAARAINTMGFHELVVVGSKCHQQDEARWLAHGSRHILDSIIECETLQDAIDGCEWVIGTTAKRRLQADCYLTPQEARGWAEERVSGDVDLAIVFGRENNGLTNQELAQCSVLSTVPLANPSPSINLAQSVMIYAFVFSSLSAHTPLVKPVERSEWDHMNERVNHLLDRLNFYPNSKLRQWVSECLPLAHERPTRFLLSIAKRIEERIKIDH